MKKIFLTLFCITLAAISVKGESVVTLHHNGVTTPFYGNNAFVEAYNASSHGDTIILPGKYYNPPSLINKKLTIIGTGHTPDSTMATNITRITSGLNLGENADSTCIEGLYISGDISFATDKSIDRVVIRRNYLTGGIVFNGSRTTPCVSPFIYNNFIMTDVWGDNATGMVLANNLINFAAYNIHNGIIENNIFFNVRNNYNCPSCCCSGNQNHCLYQITQSVIQNNIFIGGYFIHSATLTLSTNNEIYNNLFTFTPSYLNNVNSGNYSSVTQNSIFVNQTGNTPNYTHDYHLQTNAASAYIGADGTQVGIYGGYYPYKTAALPSNPHISYKSVAPVTNGNGKLGVNIKVNAQEN